MSATIKKEVTSSLWIFGYGSLVWKPSFEYISKVTGYVKGYKRRFWQGSTDHRGVPENPGRVVTLIPSEKDYVWGVCYEVSEENIEKTLKYLDHREKGGYARDSVIVYKNIDDPEPVLENVLVYTATETNPDYLGEIDEYLIAKQILSSHGPSGSNLEYFMRLAKSLEEHNVVDEHIVTIEKYIKEIQKELNQLKEDEATDGSTLVDGIKIKI